MERGRLARAFPNAQFVAHMERVMERGRLARAFLILISRK
jgi:hypothetical protein